MQLRLFIEKSRDLSMDMNLSLIEKLSMKQKAQLLSNPIETILANVSELQSKITANRLQFSELSRTFKHLETQNWTEKYQPKRYDELLTDELTCRNIITWFSTWNPLVFKKEFKFSENKGMYFQYENKGVRPLLLNFPRSVSD